ncbi:MAG: ferrous iron transport protein A [Immundisolibacteraceae bacterium]|nr:ferrous iron transport protein A [Immundisolibacteraceae bacterium]
MLNKTTLPKLQDLKPGEVARVVGFESGHRPYRRKLLSMGLTPGIEIQIIRFAPLGDPVEIRIRGFHLSLRRDEANILLLQRT